jgi:hypothetical protein
MKHAEKLAPAGALTAALISIACCVPLSIPAALGIGGLAMFASVHQVWLIAGSFLLLIAGVVQMVVRPACHRRSRTSIILLCVAAVLVLAVTFFPQSIAGALADYLH